MNFLCLSLTFLALNLGACAKSEQPKVKAFEGGGGDSAPNPNEKLGLAPEYDSSQFKIGQWIEWERKSGNKTEYYRWKWTKSFPEGLRIEGRMSKQKCKESTDNYETEVILFNPEDGQTDQRFYTEEGWRPGPMKNIFAIIYGNPNKVNEAYIPVASTIGSDRYETFQLKRSKNTLFLNQPGSPFHAMALKYDQKIETANWTYTLSCSNPPIQTLPK
jgi:hypothetical protein